MTLAILYLSVARVGGSDPVESSFFRGNSNVASSESGDQNHRRLDERDVRRQIKQDEVEALRRTLGVDGFLYYTDPLGHLRTGTHEYDNGVVTAVPSAASGGDFGRLAIPNYYQRDANCRPDLAKFYKEISSFFVRECSSDKCETDDLGHLRENSSTNLVVANFDSKENGDEDYNSATGLYNKLVYKVNSLGHLRRLRSLGNALVYANFDSTRCVKTIIDELTIAHPNGITVDDKIIKIVVKATAILAPTQPNGGSNRIIASGTGACAGETDILASCDPTWCPTEKEGIVEPDSGDDRYWYANKNCRATCCKFLNYLL